MKFSVVFIMLVVCVGAETQAGRLFSRNRSSRCRVLRASEVTKPVRSSSIDHLRPGTVKRSAASDVGPPAPFEVLTVPASPTLLIESGPPAPFDPAPAPVPVTPKTVLPLPQLNKIEPTKSTRPVFQLFYPEKSKPRSKKNDPDVSKTAIRVNSQTRPAAPSIFSLHKIVVGKSKLDQWYLDQSRNIAPEHGSSSSIVDWHGRQDWQLPQPGEGDHGVVERFGAVSGTRQIGFLNRHLWPYPR